MGTSSRKIRPDPFLHQLIDLESLERLCEKIELSTGLPLQLRSLTGEPWPGVAPSIPCCQLILESPKGRASCYRKAKVHCPSSAGETGEYLCAGTAHHLVAPIVVGGRRVALLVLGPYLYYPPGRDAAFKQARQYDVDEGLFFRAFSKIPLSLSRRSEELEHQLGLASLLVSEQLEMALRNAQLRQKSEQRAREVEALAEVGSLVLRADDLEGTFGELASRICKATGFVFSYIALLDSGKRTLKAVAAHDLRSPRTDVLNNWPALSLEEWPLLRDVIKNRTTVLVDDPLNDLSGQIFTRRFCGDLRLRSLLLAPISLKNDTIGVMALGSRRVGPLGQDNLSIVSALCNQVAIAAQNAMAYAAQIEARKRATFLAEAGQMLSSTLHPSQVLQGLAEKATEVLGESCVIVMCNKGSDLINFEVTHHLDPGKLQIHLRAQKAHALRVGEGLVGRVIQSGAPLLINENWEELFPPVLRPLMKELGVRSFIGAPIKIQERTVGAIALKESRPGKEFSENDLSFVATLAQLVSVAVEHARLYSIVATESQKLGAVISGMTDGVILFDGEGRVARINPAGSEILAPVDPGTTLLQLHQLLAPRNSQGEIVPPDQVPSARVLSGTEPMAHAELTIDCPDGETRTLYFSAAPICNAHGASSGAVTVFRDITAYKQMDRLKDEFISVVSHELRAPLATISGYTQMLIKQLSRRDGHRQELGELELIKTCTHQLSNLVRNLLDVSRYESGSLTLNLRPVHLSDTLPMVVARLEHMSENHRLVVRSSADLPPVLADQNRVEQILSNLIGNAIKFSPDGGEILISAQPRHANVVVSIHDRGIGISKYDLGKLFDRFYRADNTECRPYEGIGLGLHVSKILVEVQGGQIWARSRKGDGSVFSFTLPLYGGGSAKSSSG